MIYVLHKYAVAILKLLNEKSSANNYKSSLYQKINVSSLGINKSLNLLWRPYFFPFLASQDQWTSEAPLYNFKTAHDTSTKTTPNNVLIMWARNVTHRTIV